jgi:hypothetical protein
MLDTNKEMEHMSTTKKITFGLGAAVLAGAFATTSQAATVWDWASYDGGSTFLPEGVTLDEMKITSRWTPGFGNFGTEYMNNISILRNGAPSGNLNQVGATVTQLGLDSDPLDAGDIDAIQLNNHADWFVGRWKADAGLTISQVQFYVATTQPVNPDTQDRLGIDWLDGQDNATAAAASQMTVTPVVATDDGWRTLLYTIDLSGVEASGFALTLAGSVLGSEDTPDFGGAFDPIVGSAEFTVVPEPAALALMGLGGLAMVARRRRA